MWREKTRRTEEKGRKREEKKAVTERNREDHLKLRKWLVQKWYDLRNLPGTYQETGDTTTVVGILTVVVSEKETSID